MKIIAATSNAGKIKEIKKIFADDNLEILSMAVLGSEISLSQPEVLKWIENYIKNETDNICGGAI